MSEIPHIELTGTPHQRGVAYGDAAASRVRRSVEAYRSVFSALAGWDWDRVVDEAMRYEPAIEAFGPSYLEEMKGIAEGADLEYGDILAINTRTEVMFAAKARKATGRGECSAFGVLPSRSADGHLLIGQNWDWLVHCFDTVVILEVEQEDLPNYLTVVEAGLLAKTGMNSAGLGVVTNALVTTDDRGEPGIPYHVMLRALMDATTLSAALATLQAGNRSSSANYLIGHRDGVCLDVEAAPGDFSRIFLLQPDDGMLLHTNHFISPRFDGTDVSIWAMPDSPVRLQRLQSLVDGHAEPIDVQTVGAWLGDHVNYPAGVCCHPDTTLPETEQDATVVSAIMDVTEGRMWIADGHPCTAPFRVLEPRGALATTAAD